MNRALVILLIIFIAGSTITANPSKIKDLERKLEKAIDTTRVNTLLELSVLYLRKNSQHADSIANEAFNESVKIGFLKGRIKSMIYLGNIKSFQGNHQLGNRYCKQALSLSDSINDQKLLSESYDLLYLLRYRKGVYDSATMAANTSLEYALSSNHQKMLARGNQNLGILNSIKGNHAEAIKYFLQSEKYYTEMGDEFALALLLGNMGVTFEEAGNYTKSLEYMHKQLKIGEKLADDFLTSNALANIGAVFSQIGNQDSAIIYYKKSLVIAQAVKNYDLIILNLDNIGSYYSNVAAYSTATTHLRSAYEMATEKGFEYQNVYITGHLAQNYLAQKKYDSALLYASEQLSLALEYEFLYDQKLAYDNLSKIYMSIKDFEKAHEALSNYIMINDSLFSQDKTNQIEGLREQYEADKKEQEIENLKAINETARYRNISYAGAAISFLILGGLLYYVQRLRARRNHLLLEQGKELDRMKSRFFANISHEFRTPLTLILGPLDDLISKIKETSIKRQLKVMQRNAGRLLDLVNQLLDLSKIESGKLALEASNSDIIAVIRAVAMSFHSIAEQKSIKLDLEISPDELTINYDRAKLETILTNLLSNAFKFTPVHGRITIKTKITCKNESNGYWEYLSITVSDTGPGIPGEEINQIFNRFYQANNSQLLQQEGSGIGLALTKELVELHEGRISAESKIGEGTRIFIELPTDLAATVSDQLKTEVFLPVMVTEALEMPADFEKHGVLQGDQAVVLVVEDNADVRKYIHETLLDTYSIVTAIDGDEGISTALEIIPDLILSDVMMPKKDGFEVCHTLKNNEKTSHIPIILLTAKSDSDDKIAGLMTKADDYVTKPFVPKELMVRIDNLIESRKLLRDKYKKEGVFKPQDIAANSVDEQFLTRLIEKVELHMSDETFGVEQLGDELSMSRSQLHRKLKALLDQGPNQFIRSFRLQRAHDLLKQQSATSSEIAYQVGFGSPSYFTKCFHEQFGYTPTEIHE